jgi:hypothetical protein
LTDNLNDPTHIMPPMPADAAAPYAGTLVKMCIAEQGWSLVNGQIQFWDRLIDQGDGWVKGP